jgi:hypothetical protein
MKFREGIDDSLVEKFFREINLTSMKRPDFAKFKKAYQARDVVLSVWVDEELVGFGSMLTE